MAADLRVLSVLIEPAHKTVEDALRISVEFMNTGDAVTEDFLVFLDVDGAQFFYVPAPSVNPGDTAFVVQPLDALPQDGDHFVNCVLDPEGTVSAFQRDMQVTQHFTVQPVEFGPDDSYAGSQDFDFAGLTSAVIAELNSRINEWFGDADQTVSEWVSVARGRVKELESDGKGEVDIGSIAWALALTLPALIPGAGEAWAAGVAVAQFFTDAAEKVDAASKEHADASLSQQLYDGVTDIQVETGNALRNARTTFLASIPETFSERNLYNPLLKIEFGSTDPAYVGDVCTWLGVPPVTDANCREPVSNELMTKFESFLDEVSRKLLRQEGYDV